MDLTIIGFLIAVVGVVLQLADAFPEHRETRKVIVIMAVGVFIGILASSALGAHYTVTGDVDRRFALLYGLAAISAFFGFLAVLVGDEKRREVAAVFAACAGVGFLLAGFFVALGSHSPNTRYSTDEVLILANAAEERREYETAIERLKELESRLKTDQTRHAIRQRIAQIEATRDASVTAREK